MEGGLRACRWECGRWVKGRWEFSGGLSVVVRVEGRLSGTLECVLRPDESVKYDFWVGGISLASFSV